MRATAALILTLYLLHEIVAELNSALSGFHIWLFAGGLFVAYSALAMPLGQGFAASAFSGFLCDCASPVAFGTHAALFCAAHAVVFNLRERVQREDTIVRVSVALLINLALFLVLSLLRTKAALVGAAAWPRLISDLLCSEGMILLAAPWFFALQVRTLELARAKSSRLA